MNLIYKFDIVDFNIFYYFFIILTKSSLAKSVRNIQLGKREWSRYKQQLFMSCFARMISIRWCSQFSDERGITTRCKPRPYFIILLINHCIHIVVAILAFWTYSISGGGKIVAVLAWGSHCELRDITDLLPNTKISWIVPVTFPYQIMSWCIFVRWLPTWQCNLMVSLTPNYKLTRFMG